MNLEGRIRIALHTEAGRVSHVAIESTRPQLAQRMMAGRTPQEAADLAGLLFSLCGRAQRIAAQLACAAALDEMTVSTDSGSHILAEWTREHAWRLLLNWPETAGQPLRMADLQALQRAGEDTTALAPALDSLLNTALLGEAATSWLQRDWHGLQDWLAAGRGAASLFDPAPAVAAPGAHDFHFLPLLDSLGEADINDLADTAFADTGFCTRPRWHSRTVETGPLARLSHHPWIDEWHARFGLDANARLLARLIELARLPARLRSEPEVEREAVARAWHLADSTGVAAVETSRGLLLHMARLDAGKVRDYRIVSPTEWNFHPQGMLYQSLLQLPADVLLENRARRLALAFDPCVDYGLNIDA